MTVTRSLTQPLTRPLAAAVTQGVGGGWVQRGEDGAMPLLDYDFVNRRYYRQGAYRTEASEFTTAAGSPSYGASGLLVPAGARVTGLTPSFFPLAGSTLLVETVKPTAAGLTTGFSMTYINGAATSRFEISRNITTNVSHVQVSDGPTTYLSNTFGSADLVQQEDRIVMALEVGQKARIFTGGAYADAVGTTLAAFANAFAAMGIGYRARFDDQSLDGTVRRITLWPAAYSAAWVKAAGIRTTKTNLHVLGDSFVNSAYTSTLRDKYVAAPYRVFSFDGVGSSTLTQQADRFDLTPDKWDRTLIIMDGGLDTDAATSIAAINRMVAKLTHSRWLYVQPSPAENAAGSPARITFDATVAAIRASVGEDHFVETLPAALAASTGSANDLADVANNIWPRSLRTDTIHPTTAGWGTAIATPLAAKLAANGWA